MVMTLAQTQASHPLDLSALEHVTDPEEYDRIIHDAIRRQLQSGGLVSPTENVTNFKTEPPDTPSWIEQMGRKIFNMNSEVFDSPDPDDKNNYLQRRFEFITGHEGWREKTYKDSRGLRTVGFGFNLEEPTNRELYKPSLKKTDAEFDALRDGKTALNIREGRILFEASSGAAERLITQKFGDMDLKGYERLALVSLAYNHPKLIGPNLTKHVRAGDKEMVLDEIRHRSNLHKIKGIANRREHEAMLFSGMHQDDTEESGFSLASLFGVSKAEAATMKSSEDLIARGRDAVQTSEQDAPKPEESEGLLDRVGRGINEIIVNNIPSNARVAVQDILGINFDELQREDYFSFDQINLLREMVAKKMKAGQTKRGSWQYKDYDTHVSGVEWSGDIGKFTPQYVMKTTLGRFSYEVKENGDVIIEDQFNYNDAKKLQKKYPTTKDKLLHLVEFAQDENIGNYGIMRRVGALFGSGENEGIKFEINLGNLRDIV